MAPNKLPARMYVQCERARVKAVKNWLESQDCLFKGEKIKPAGNDENDSSGNQNSAFMLVPTTGITTTPIEVEGLSTSIRDAEQLVSCTYRGREIPEAVKDAITARFFTLEMPLDDEGEKDPNALNALQKKFSQFLHYPSTLRTIEKINEHPDKTTHLSFQKLLDEAPKRWVLYPPMVMLQQNCFSADWERLLSASLIGDTNFLWQEILEEFSTDVRRYTHIAVNKGIPLDNEDENDNTIRAPSSELRRFYGDFGPDIPSDRFYLPPDARNLIGTKDFDDAFWVKTKQNGLIQVWAPRWTMFSRGNVKEKARVLTFDKAAYYASGGKNGPLSSTSGNAQDALVVDSSSESQPSPLWSTAAQRSIDDDNYDNLSTTSHASRFASRTRFIDIASSPDPFPETEGSQNAPLLPPSDDDIHMGGDASSELRPARHATKATKRKLRSEDSKASKHVKPKFQEVQLVLDLYAGIGYFTLSYLKLGYDVIAYELNPFSVEGLRRGVRANGFACTVLRGQELMTVTSEGYRQARIRDVSLSVAGKDEKDPVVHGDHDNDKKVIVDEGYASRHMNSVVDNHDELGDETRQDNEAMVIDNEDATLVGDASVLQEAPDDSDFIVVDRDVSLADADAEFELVNEESLFVDQAVPAASSTTKAAENTTEKPQGNKTRKFAIPKRLHPNRPNTLKSLEDSLQGQFKRPSRVIVYEQSNEHAYTNFIALSTQHGNRGGNPYRIRHINLGFLPSSSASWDTAAQLIATNIDGGWIHVHENVGVSDMAKRKEEVVQAFHELVNPYHGTGIKGRRVTCSHMEQVKSYAPGVWHVVYDVCVGPKNPINGEERRGRMMDESYYDGAGENNSSGDEYVMEGDAK